MKTHEIFNTILTVILLVSIFLYWFVLYPDLEKPILLVGEGVRVTFDIGADTMRVEIDEPIDSNNLTIQQVQNAFESYNDVFTKRKYVN